ncbi:putative BOI-related E3 ubiquitin-protein ligase 3 [Canna indica]|uniref:BOI-related E3 ubiquitin-protein ligase 3 n=1 Tax=Canna indica TaxID=4628 RepID=A0AAQ3QGY6_9LILI|nr:putative BOI-related E3 ubiquitin-protein ligase 3 [Canna indica]
MAVEAHHLDLLPSQLLRNNREFNNSVENQASLYNMQMGFVTPVSGSVAAATGSSFLPMYNPLMVPQASDSGLTFDNAAAVAAASRKRPRPSPFDDQSYYLQQQMFDVDRLILQHAERMRAEMAERRRRFVRRILASVEDGVSKRLMAREEEIARIGRVNWALEERIKRLCVENQMWRDVAQSNEAAANALRASLEQVLAVQVRVKNEEAAEEGAASSADDAESCCCVAGNGEDQEEAGVRRVCRGCGQREPSVLLLPCRHLCLCAACGAAAASCPICNCSNTGSLSVNMSLS